MIDLAEQPGVRGVPADHDHRCRTAVGCDADEAGLTDRLDVGERELVDHESELDEGGLDGRLRRRRPRGPQHEAGGRRDDPSDAEGDQDRRDRTDRGEDGTDHREGQDDGDNAPGRPNEVRRRREQHRGRDGEPDDRAGRQRSGVRSRSLSDRVDIDQVGDGKCDDGGDRTDRHERERQREVAADQQRADDDDHCPDTADQEQPRADVDDPVRKVGQIAVHIVGAGGEVVRDREARGDQQQAQDQLDHVARPTTDAARGDDPEQARLPSGRRRDCEHSGLSGHARAGARAQAVRHRRRAYDAVRITSADPDGFADERGTAVACRQMSRTAWMRPAVRRTD